MSHEEMMRNMALAEDKRDFLNVLEQRFGAVPDDIVKKIEAITELDVMDRLFLVAVNAASWDIFVTELNEGKDSFKIIGENFNPLAKVQEKKENKAD
ncbi:MAG TPA: hypothetical protein VJ824_10165 [Bacillota bacterium]|nr:hypothetical protein [Bacillota bacterium]